MMAAVGAANNGEQAAAEANAAAAAQPLAATLDPRLMMAARRGDWRQLEEQGTPGASATAADADVPVPVPAAADQVVVVVDIPPQAPAAPTADAASLSLLENGVVTLLDVAADGQEQGATAAGMSVAAAEYDVVEAAAARDDVRPNEDDDTEEEAVHPPPPHDDTVGVTMEGDSLLHVVAASGDSEDFLRFAVMIVRDKGKKGGAAAMRVALEARNNAGDTPLHRAAGAGNAKMIRCLVGLLLATTTHDDHEAAALKSAFVRIRNERGETALHHAVKWAACCSNRRQRPAPAVNNSNNNWWALASITQSNRAIHAGCIGKLIAVDSELASITAHDGTSPLYLAISLGEMEIARYLLVTAKGEGNRMSYYSGPGGQNILHAAVSCGDARVLRVVLAWLKEPKTAAADDLVQQEEAAAGAHALVLIKQLTCQRDKKNGSTPLHLAASLFGFPSTVFNPGWSWVRSGLPAARLLLDADESMAYQPDKEGMYPIHAAAGGGSLSTVNTLLRRCPGCADLRDAKGRTFLHVAVDKGVESIFVVISVCRRPRLSWILNVQDNNGDTALHHAVHAANYEAFFRLVRNPQVRLDIPNNKGMRPIDVSWSTMPLEAYYAWDPRLQMRNWLLKLSAPYGESRGDLFMEKDAAAAITISPEVEKQVLGASEGLTSAAQVMGILSVLVTTVTFATAFTLPGGYRSDSGTPVLAGSYAFDAFLLADALAFICSLLATSLLLYGGVPAHSLKIRFRCVNCAYTLMMNSGRSLVAAFGLGLYVALSPVARTIPIAIAVSMAMLAYVFIKGGESIESLFFTSYPMLPIRRRPSLMRFLAGWIVFLLNYFWSFLLIFGLPAIRRWAGAR